MRDRSRKPRPRLDREALSTLALHYVARFATSRGRLLRYLERKLAERGWDGTEDAPAAAAAAADRLVELGYVDDQAFAAARARTLEARGLGPRRLAADLAQAGIAEDDRAAAVLDEQQSALAFARRRRLGPFAAAPADRPTRERQLAAMARAGHRLGLARAILDCPPGEEPDF